MPEEIQALWRRLEAWAQGEAPAMLALLRGPASAADLERLERATGLALPADLRASLLVHDGEEANDLLCVWRDRGRLLPAAEIRESWLQRREFAEEPDPPERIAASIADSIISVEGPVHPVAFREGWIPFMDCNGDVTWFIDLDPASGGVRGQVIEEDLEGCDWKVLAPSFEAFLCDYVGTLEAGEFDARDEQGLPERSSDLLALQSGPSPAEIADQEQYFRHYYRPLPLVVRFLYWLFSGRRMKRPQLSGEQLLRLTRLMRAPNWHKLTALPAGTRTELVGIVGASAGDLHQVAISGGYIQARGAIDPSPGPLRVFRLELEIGEGRSRAVHTIRRAERVDLDRD